MQLKRLSTNWKRWFKVLGFLFILALLTYWLRTDFWEVKKINCNLDDDGCPLEIENRVSNLSLRKNIIFLPKEEIKESLRKNLPQIHLIEIRRKIPQTLNFNLTSRKLMAALAVELPLIEEEATESAEIKSPEFNLSGIFYLIDQQGVILEKGNESKNLPLILLDYDPSFEFGDQVKKEEILKTIEVLLGLRLRLIDPKITKIISIREVRVWLENNLLCLFNLTKDINEQLDSLQLISSRAKIEGKQITRIDLRFDKPVIAY